MATILIVDDLPGNRKVLAALLASGGHRLIEAADGRAGLAAARAEHPDLVITDVLMPLVDGYEFVRQLRLDPATSAIPVLFYTAPYGEREARALARAGGVPYVLTKPPQPDEVLRIVDRVLAGALEIDADAESAADTGLDREQLQLLSDQLAETAEELRRANAQLRALINIGLDFAAQRDRERRLQRLCDAIHDLFSASYVTIGTTGTDLRVRRFVASGIDTATWITAGDALQGIFATVVGDRRAARGEIAAAGAESRPFPDQHPEVRDYLIVPITSPASVYGWICLVCNDGRPFTLGEERQVLALAGQVGRIYELEHEVAERLEAEAALEHSERLNRNLVEHLPHRILVKDRNSVILFCNANYANDVGLRVDEVIGKDAFALHAPELAEAYQANDRQVMESGALQDLEEPCRGVNGQERWVHTVKVPYRDAQGVVTGVLVVFEDVTDRRLLEQQYQQAQKMEAVGELAGGVAHDFNNLLTAILGYCELIAVDLTPDDPHRDDIGEIQKAGRRAAELTRQLLAFSRKEIIAPTTIDLNALVSEMRPMLDRLIREDVRILVGLGQHLAPVTADRGQIEQIVMNLAVNARDAMPTGGTLTIETANVEVDAKMARQHGARAAGPHVSLTVTDTGSGMTADVKARIFEPFFTTKARGRGTGLGLASVQGTIARSGGSISVLSEVGKGSSFQVLLPRAEATLAAPPPAPVVAAITGTETVLVVEDADELRGLISLLLKRQGYTVLVAENADEAKRQFAAHAAIDLVLTDVVMPGASGPALSRELQASRPNLKVLYMSGYTQDAIVQHGVLLPGIAFLAKPFTAETLGKKIRAVLDGPRSKDA